MQIMPATAASLGLSRVHDPLGNLRAGARYLRQQIDRFGRIDLALAAYNAGPERRSLAQGRIPRIPETQAYVKSIFANWARLVAHNAAPVMPMEEQQGPLPTPQAPVRKVELETFSDRGARQ